jgi:hypothetical protein
MVEPQGMALRPTAGHAGGSLTVKGELSEARFACRPKPPHRVELSGTSAGFL